MYSSDYECVAVYSHACPKSLRGLCILRLVIVLQCVPSLYLRGHIYTIRLFFFCRVSITIYTGRPMEKLITIIIIPIA